MAEDNVQSQKNPGNIEYMPDELARFVQRETYSLLIKGFAGTGKTTLALTILKALGIKSNFFYISTRISPKQLFQYYSWLPEFVEQPNNAGPGEMVESGTGLSSFEDARLDEPESLFERITNQLMDVKSPVIIIDSWDAIASFMDKEARLNNERVLQTWRERAGAKLIFIGEHPDDTTLDFLVDGIVELKQNYYDSIRIREAFLLKLRGVIINRPSYIYSLDNSIFKSYNPFNPMEVMPDFMQSSADAKKNRELEKTYSQQPSHQTPSYSDLDRMLGGFPKRGIILIELDQHVNTRVGMALLGRLMSGFIAQDSPILFHPFDGTDPDSAMSYIDPFLSLLPKKKLFKIIWPDSMQAIRSEYVQILKTKGAAKKVEQLQSIMLQMRKSRSGKPFVNIMGTDIVQNLYDDKAIRGNIGSFLSTVRTMADLSVIVTRHSHPFLEYLAELSDIHIKLLMMNGTLFLQSIIPWSNLYAVTFLKSGKTIDIRLDPMV